MQTIDVWGELLSYNGKRICRKNMGTISHNYETFINAAMWTDKAHKLLNKL